jgi:predicted phosphodiesterase
MMRSGLLLFSAILLLAIPAGAANTTGGTPLLLRGPYLTPAGGNALTVHVWTDRQAEVLVEFGEEAAMLGGSTSSREVPSTSVSGHHQVLLANLTPGTRYRYRVIYGGTSTGDLHFTTCPESGPVSFLVLGDTQDLPPSFRMEDRFSLVADRMAAEQGISFVVHTGDFVGNGSSDEDWDRFFTAAGPLLAGTVLLPVRGNHDGSAERFSETFGVPGHYSFSCGDVQVAVLDSGDDAWQDLPAQARWLDLVLARGPPFRFAALHYPLASSDERHLGGWENLRTTFLPVLSRDGVMAVFQGHVHLYERDMTAGIQFLTDGRGGAPPYPFGAGRDPGYQYGVENTLGYTRVSTMSPDLPARVEVVQVADLKDGRVILSPPGKVVEQIMLTTRVHGPSFIRPGRGRDDSPGSALEILAFHAFLRQEIDFLIGSHAYPPA